MKLSALVLTYNEAANLARTLAALTRLPRVVVLDSHSTDDTLAIARSFANVETHVRTFDAHAPQWNHGLSLVHSEWVLTLDADYVLPEPALDEILRVVGAPEHDGYEAPLAYCIQGRRLRHAILPPRTVLFRRGAGSYVQDGHTQRLVLVGSLGRLEHAILHDDRKSLTRWLWAQDRYTDLEVEKLTTHRWRELSMPDRLRKLAVITPWLVPAYYLGVKGGFRDGVAGLDYAAQRSVAELILSIKLLERHLQRSDDPRSP